MLRRRRATAHLIAMIALVGAGGTLGNLVRAGLEARGERGRD
jgi:hypothetical protein